MPLNSSGPISLAGTVSGQSIELELGGNGTTSISLNNSSVRTLAGVASGAIQMPTNFWGKSNRAAVSYTYASNIANASLNITSISGYVSGATDVTIYVNSGVYVYSTNIANAGLTITGGSGTDTVTLVNNGYIMGQGGNGIPSGSGPFYGNPGGPALSLGWNTTINNTNTSAYIGGGGGNGGSSYSGAGGGAGGGLGSRSSPGAGGAPGQTGGNANGGAAPGGKGGGAGGGGGAYSSSSGGRGSGGGGGRIFPGSGGAGGSGAGAGSAGGGGNSAGGGASNRAGAGGGGWGASGGNNTSQQISGAGGAGGNAVKRNGYTVTFTSGDTSRVYGAIS